MRRLALLALVVPLLAGCNWASLLFGANYPGASTHGPTVTYGVAPPATDAEVPHWVAVEHLPSRAWTGANLFATSGCTVCHTYAGSGRMSLHAPDLTAIGRRHLGISLEVKHLECPSCVDPGSPMPSFARIGPKRLRDLAIFLEASKGVR